MDPVSQAALGAAAALAISKPNLTRLAALAGAVGGALADLDVLIASDTDPLLNIEFHRHFTHSLTFIPIGGLLACLLLFPFLKKRITLPILYLYCTAGYATAGLLDACTSYGTQLLWPFANTRVSWSVISIVDPLFTLPLLATIALTLFPKPRNTRRISLAFALAYLSFGTLQNHRAAAFQQSLITQRGHHSATRPTVKPSIANLILWRSVYLHEGTYYVDALRLTTFGPNIAYPGQSLPAFDTEAAIASLPHQSPLADDYRRFDHFSEGYLAALPDEPTFIADLRYSTIPNSTAPLWGIDISDTTSTGHAAFETRRQITPAGRKAFLQMLKAAPLPTTP